MQINDMVMDSHPKRPLGRSLADFRLDGTTAPNGLYPAEEKLLECARRGEQCNLGDTLPDPSSEEFSVRAEFVRFLALGGDEFAPVHELGVWLRGAWIQGNLGLNGCREVKRLGLQDCWIDGKINLRDAQTQIIYLRGSRVASIEAERIRVDGDMLLNAGFKAEGPVRLIGGNISGDLYCSGGQFIGENGSAIACERCSIHGNVFLNKNFAANGEVSFAGSDIGGQFNCEGGVFENPSGIALGCDDIQVRGTVLLTRGFRSSGEVRFQNGKVEGDFGCDGGNFAILRSQRYGLSRAPLAHYALDIRGVKVGGILWLGPAGPDFDQHVSIRGSLNLQNATVSVYVDHPDSWPVPTIHTPDAGEVACIIALDGYKYERFRGIAPTRAEIRREWLLRQRKDDLDESFRPQPFEQLVRVLRDMGHDADARRIAMFKESLLHPIRTRQTRLIYRPFVWLTGKVWGIFCGYGYRPHRLIVALGLLWLGCAALYQISAEHGGFGPRDPQVWANAAYDDCRQNWTKCDKIAEETAFNAFIYSADVLLPVIDLGQRSSWAPLSRAITISLPSIGETILPKSTFRVISWIENILGTLGVILIGAILSGIVSRD